MRWGEIKELTMNWSYRNLQVLVRRLCIIQLFVHGIGVDLARQWARVRAYYLRSLLNEVNLPESRDHE